MIELKYTTTGSILSITDSNKKNIDYSLSTQEVVLDGFDISFPGEYEKSGILVETKQYQGKLFYNFLIESKRLIVIPHDSFDLKEEILTFFGDVDILIITGTKEAAKIFENIEAKLVVPYGEGKDIFLNTLGQKIEEESVYKIKGEFSLDSTEFVNLI